VIVSNVELELKRAPLLAGIPNCIYATSASLGRLNSPAAPLGHASSEPNYAYRPRGESLHF
jgi:hypothetical protein